MIDTMHSSKPTRDGDQLLRKRPAVPRRHFSFDGNDISSCYNVCVRSIIDQLGEKLDVGKPRAQQRMKHRSFQSINIQMRVASEPKARSQSMMISPLDHVVPVRLRDVLSRTHEPPQRSNDSMEVSQMHSSNASLQPPPSPNFHWSSTSCDHLEGLSPGSLGSCRSRWGLSRKMKHVDLPPAFRDSLDSSILGSNTAKKRRSLDGKLDHSNMPVPSRSLNLGKHHRSPSKLQRIWPPLPRKNRRPSQLELLESSLSDLRLMACVKSQIPSFEPPPRPLFPAVNDNQVKAQVLASSSSHLFLREGESENSSSGHQPEILRLSGPEEIPGLASALKSGKCKGSMRIRWSGPEVFFIEGRRHKSFQPLYYDDLLEDRFQSVSEHSVNKPLLIDRFGARVNDCCPGLPNRPRRHDDDDDWSDYEDEVNEGQSHGQQGPLDQSNQSGSDDIAMSRPMIWITRLDSDTPGSSLLWRVRRVWDDPRLDGLEKDRIIPDEDLLNTLKNLSGLPAIPTEQLLEQGNKFAETVNAKPLLPWSIQKIYDIDGEIMDELCSVSEFLVEEGAMLDAIVAFANETQVTSSSQPLVQDDWKTTSLDVMAPSAPLDTSVVQGPRAHLEESISVIETDDGLSLGDSRAELLTPASKTRKKVIPNIKVPELSSPSASSTALDSITRESSDAIVITSTSVLPPSGSEVNPVDEPQGTPETKEKKKKKRRDHGTLASLLSPPPVLTFYDFTD